MSSSVFLNYWFGDQSRRRTSFFPYINISVISCVNLRLNRSSLDGGLMQLSLLILNVFSTEWYAKIFVFPFLKTQISWEFLVARPPPFCLSCDFVGWVQLEKRTVSLCLPVLTNVNKDWIELNWTRPVPHFSTRQLRGVDSALPHTLQRRHRIQPGTNDTQDMLRRRSERPTSTTTEGSAGEQRIRPLRWLIDSWPEPSTHQERNSWKEN